MTFTTEPRTTSVPAHEAELAERLQGFMMAYMCRAGGDRVEYRGGTLLFALGLALACGPEAAPPEEGSDSTTSTGATAGTPSTEHGTGSEGSDEGNADGSGGDDACAAYGLPTQSHLSVVLENRTQETIFVDPHRGQGEGCYERLPFSISRMGADEPIVHELGGCPTMCWSELSLCDSVLCPASCDDFNVIRIDPGGSYTVEWRPVEYRKTEIPLECAPCDAPWRTDCFIAEALGDDDTYALIAWAVLEPHCFSAVCDCEPTPEGSCIVANAIAIEPYITARATTLGLPATLELVFTP